ncbi:hypothetical protein O8B93_26700 [Agrobacterium rhizogenes]|nr:hypothetical protein [Rhizobium rhizogenes]MCZ7451159.1 hypothetical protein [Rhizobium rhizogenes]
MIRWTMMVGDIVGADLIVGSDGFAICSRLGSSSRKNLLATHPSF